VRPRILLFMTLRVPEVLVLPCTTLMRLVYYTGIICKDHIVCLFQIRLVVVATFCTLIQWVNVIIAWEVEILNLFLLELHEIRFSEVH
jgi:hypothetical protein